MTYKMKISLIANIVILYSNIILYYKYKIYFACNLIHKNINIVCYAILLLLEIFSIYCSMKQVINVVRTKSSAK